MHVKITYIHEHRHDQYDYVTGFDLCKLAEQALDRRFFDAAVVFYDLCSTRIRQNEALNVKAVGIFKNTHLSAITSKKSASLLRKAIRVHDHAFEHLGRLGPNHRCNGKPYRTRNRKNATLSSQQSTNQLAFNITDLWYYNITAPIFEPITFGNVEAELADKLCRGGKLKVQICLKRRFQIMILSKLYL